jgi:hypothetical protein
MRPSLYPSKGDIMSIHINTNVLRVAQPITAKIASAVAAELTHRQFKKETDDDTNLKVLAADAATSMVAGAAAAGIVTLAFEVVIKRLEQKSVVTAIDIATTESTED